MLPTYPYIYIFIYLQIMMRMVEGCPDVRSVGKVRKGYAFRLRVAA